MKIVTALGRAYEDEPAKHKCYYDGKNYRVIKYEYSDQDIDTWMGWPFGYLYEYEEELFKKLRRAFQEKDQENLNKYWQEAKLLTLHFDEEKCLNT